MSYIEKIVSWMPREIFGIPRALFLEACVAGAVIVTVAVVLVKIRNRRAQNRFVEAYSYAFNQVKDAEEEVE